MAKDSVTEISNKLKSNAKGRVAFRLHIIGDGSSLLYGVGLPNGLEKFNDKIDTMNQSQLFPYAVRIEDGGANILHAKFHQALSVPQLSMTEFMKIMSVPGNIADAFKMDYK